MMRLTYSVFLISIIMMFSACKSTSLTGSHSIVNKTPFGVCYAKVTPEQVSNYKLVIIEPDFYTKAEIQALKATGSTIIAYITLGEVDPNRWYFPLLEQQGFLGMNENWGSSYLDLSKEEVRSILLDRVLPEIMVKGVDGVFLDTIDAVAPYGERKELAPYMVEVISNIRIRYPDVTVIQNAGLFLLKETKSVIDAVLIEDIASGYDFENQRYYVKALNEFNDRKELVISTSEKYNIPVFIVDFADTEAGISEVKSRLDTLNTPYFISNIQLSQLPERTGRVANRIRRD